MKLMLTKICMPPAQRSGDKTTVIYAYQHLYYKARDVCFILLVEHIIYFEYPILSTSFFKQEQRKPIIALSSSSKSDKKKSEW